MEGHEGLQLGAVASQLQHAATAEAETEGGLAGRIDSRERLSAQGRQRCLHALAQQGQSFFSGIIAAPASSPFCGRTSLP